MKGSYGQILEAAAGQFRDAGIREAELDAWYLLKECFSIDRTHFLLERNTEKELSEDSLERFRQMCGRREKRIPLQQILGRQEFMGLEFLVNDAVLIPRQDTEILVEWVLEDRKGCPGGEVLDLCAGSGCILLSLLKLGEFAGGTGADLSEKALETARENGRRLGVAARWYHSDLLDQVPREKYEVIVSNPPYISGEELAGLEPEVRDYEPRMALYAPENGLAFYRRLAAECRDYLKPEGKLYLEIGSSQAAAVTGFLAENGWTEIRVRKDLAGLDRVVSAVLPGKEASHV